MWTPQFVFVLELSALPFWDLFVATSAPHLYLHLGDMGNEPPAAAIGTWGSVSFQDPVRAWGWLTHRQQTGP